MRCSAQRWPVDDCAPHCATWMHRRRCLRMTVARRRTSVSSSSAVPWATLRTCAPAPAPRTAPPRKLARPGGRDLWCCSRAQQREAWRRLALRFSSRGRPFIEAMRHLKLRIGAENFCSVYVSLIPCLGVVGEQKTKPTQARPWPSPPPGRARTASPAPRSRSAGCVSAGLAARREGAAHAGHGARPAGLPRREAAPRGDQGKARPALPGGQGRPSLPTAPHKAPSHSNVRALRTHGVARTASVGCPFARLVRAALRARAGAAQPRDQRARRVQHHARATAHARAGRDQHADQEAAAGVADPQAPHGVGRHRAAHRQLHREHHDRAGGQVQRPHGLVPLGGQEPCARLRRRQPQAQDRVGIGAPEPPRHPAAAAHRRPLARCRCRGGEGGGEGESLTAVYAPPPPPV